METYDPYKELKNLRSDDSLKKLRRDHGKAEEIISQLIVAVEQLGGTSNDLFSLISGPSITPQIKHIAELIMGRLRLKSIDPLEVLTNTGMSDAVRLYAVTNGGIKEEDLPIHVLFDPGFNYPRTRSAIIEQLNDQLKLKEVALKSVRMDDGVLAVSKIKSPDDLYDIATATDINHARFAAVRSLPKSHLDRFIKDWPDGPLRQAAIARRNEL